MEQTTKVVTGKVRFSYVAVFQPKAMDEKSDPKYSVSIIIPKNDKATLDRVNKAIEAAKVAGKAKLADKTGKIPANSKVPLRDGDTDRPDDEAYADSFFINASHVDLLRKDANGYALAQLDKDGVKPIPVSRRYYDAVIALL